jgi:anti-anti-sigma factor
MRFSLTRHQSDNVVTLILVGEVDMGAAGALNSAIHDALYPPGRVAVVVDLARVMFLDCAGIGALVAGRNTAVRQGSRYPVVNPQRQVRRAMELTGVLTALVGNPLPAPVTGRPTRSRWSERRRDDRPVAGQLPGTVDRRGALL